jgi:hypothetical protein
MRRVLLTTSILLLGGSACLAQVSTMGSTAMGLPTTPGTIVISPLNGPGPFSATTQPGTSDTTLAPVPLASDPATPGTVVTCSTPTGQIAPGTPAVPVTSMSAIGGTMGSMPSAAAIPTISAVPAASATSATSNGIAPYLTLSAQPATSVHDRHSRHDHTGTAAAHNASSASAFHRGPVRASAIDDIERGLPIHHGRHTCDAHIDHDHVVTCVGDHSHAVRRQYDGNHTVGAPGRRRIDHCMQFDAGRPADQRRGPAAVDTGRSG